MKKILVALLAAFLSACGHPGSEYVGKWQTDDGKHICEISQNGESLLLKLTDPAYKGTFISQAGTTTTATFAGTVKDGVLKIDGPLGTIGIPYVKADDKLLFPNFMGGNLEYKRVK
ncbi:MAG TPA: hypothetical protein VF450_10250 [Noviherbaspirillum sp.]